MRPLKCFLISEAFVAAASVRKKKNGYIYCNICRLDTMTEEDGACRPPPSSHSIKKKKIEKELD